MAYNPVQLHFGKNVISGLGKTVLRYGKNVLLLLGKGSAKRLGYYDQVVTQLKKDRIRWVEMEGIKPKAISPLRR